MKLNKTQVNALTKRIYDELYDNIKKHNDDLELPYPDLSKFEIYKQ